MTSVTYYPGYSQEQVKDNLLCRDIASITNAYPMVVTTTVDHGYVAGMMVSFLIPIQYGMGELNGSNLQVVTILDATSVAIDFNSSQLTTFAYPSPLPSAYTPASIVPNSSGPYLPPLPLPYGNQDSFEGVIYNAGAF